MANCGCKPCSKPLPKKTKVCKPFSICVGNHSLIWDGDCASIVEREYKIPDGTYTSITFTNGCITDVGEAPIPQYTPQQCCDADGNVGTPVGSNVVASPVKGNLAQLMNGAITVKPVWDTNSNIKVAGDGTADKPWKPSIRISSKANNSLEEKEDGLFARLFFSATDTVEVSGAGTESSPYKLKVKGADAKLPQLNKTSIEGNGFTIDTEGRWRVDSDLKIVTNLQFSNPAFTVVDQGASTMIVVDDQLLKTGSHLQTGTGLSGKGTLTEPLTLTLNEETVRSILTVIESSVPLKERLKTILGV